MAPPVIPRHHWLFEAAKRVGYTFDATTLSIKDRTKESDGTGIKRTAQAAMIRLDDSVNCPTLSALIPDHLLIKHVFGARLKQVGSCKESLLLEAAFALIQELQSKLGLPLRERFVCEKTPSGRMPSVLAVREERNEAKDVNTSDRSPAADDGLADHKEDAELAEAETEDAEMADAEGDLDDNEPQQSLVAASESAGISAESIAAEPVLSAQNNLSGAEDAKRRRAASKAQSQLKRKKQRLYENRAYWAVWDQVPEQYLKEIKGTAGQPLGRLCLGTAAYIKDLQSRVEAIDALGLEIGEEVEE